jgi:transmembrane sensor
MDQKQRKATLLEKYMNNSCTQQEFDDLMEMVKTSQNFEDFDAPLKSQWNNANYNAAEHNVEWARIYNNIKLRLWALRKTKLQFKIAAVAFFAFVATGLIIYSNSNQVKQSVYLTQQSGSAKTKVVLLSDGTTVTLNANSVLRFPQSFNSKTREVYLNGEAYFQVKHNTARPFIIHSGKLQTHVLGTTFTVSAYTKTKAMNVTVLTGKVAVKNEQTQALAVLTRGQSATALNGRKGFELSQLSNPEDAIAWMYNKLIFDDADLESVAARLSNQYGVTVKINGSRLSQQHITAIFQGKQLPGIINAITRLTHSKYKVDNNTYIIY